MVLQDPLRQMMAVLDVLYCGAVVHDRPGTILYVNDRLCQMMGRGRNQLIGASARRLYGDNGDSAFIDEALAHFGERRDGEFYLPLADGGRLPVIASSAPMAAPPPLDLVQVVTLIEIARQKEVEQRLKDNYDFIVQMSNTVLEQALDLKEHSQRLEERIRQRTDQLRQANAQLHEANTELHDANMDAIYMLALASEAKDQETASHLRRIQCFTAALARRLGHGQADAQRLGHFALLHDVGKIHIPDDILKKPGPLTPDERRIMQHHAPAGERILSSRPFFATARRIARHHHENFDGSGYPDGAAGQAIPPEARIVHLVDVYDALTSRRVYKAPWPEERAIEEIRRSAGTMFDPELTRAFEALHSEGQLAQIRQSLCGPPHPGRPWPGNGSS